MARDLTSIPDIQAPNADYPNGRIQNEDPPVVGTPVIEELYGDIVQFFHKLMRLAGLSHNGLPENETNGFQFITSLTAFVRTVLASTTARGAVELADNTETQAGLDSQRAITPAGLESKTATTTRKGIAETATDAETIAKSSNLHIVTPSNLAALVASESLAGLVEQATTTEVKSKDTTKYVTGEKLAFATKNQVLNITANGTYFISDDIGLVVITGGTGSVIIRMPYQSLYHGSWEIKILNLTAYTVTLQTYTGGVQYPGSLTTGKTVRLFYVSAVPAWV